MSTFQDMKKRGDTAAELGKKLAEQDGSQSYKDDRMFELQRGKDGTAYALIRFLPAPAGEEMPFAKYFSHGGQGPGGWYIENCPTTIGGKCPLCEANSVLWKTGDKDKQEIVRKRKRKLHYVSNILVISNPSNKETEGKVFLFRYGQKIFDKIQECISPQFPDVAPSDPFNLWTGRNFRLKIITKDDFANYEQSTWDNPSPLMQDEQKLEAIWKSEYALTPFVASDKFKPYADLATRFQQVFESSAPVRTSAETPRAQAAPVNPARRPVEDAPFDTTPTASPDQDALSYFEKLAN